MKKFQRMKQQATEALGRGEKSDKLTQKLAVIEKKVEGIRNSVLMTTKKLSATIVGSGATMEKHQRKIPQNALGVVMMEHGSQIGDRSLFGSILQMVGQAEVDIASHSATYEITVAQEVVAVLNNMLEESTKPVDKCKKKLGHARLDMDSARTRLRNFEQQIEKSSKEYNMEKLTSLKMEVDEASRKFEECQDAYATSMYDFINREQEFTDKIQRMVHLQLSYYKTAAAHLEGMLPVFDKKMSESQDRPVFGLALVDHLRISKRDIAAVLDACCNELRREWMDTEGLFRIAGGQSKVKYLKTSFNAGQFDVSTHDPHTIGGCLKMYLRELPDPLLTQELYSDWMKAAGVADEQTRYRSLMTVKDKLPEANVNNFKFLCHFLYDFSLYSDITKMSVGNLAIVIGPNLLWPADESADPALMVTETALQRRIAEAFIEHCHDFFPDLPESQQPGSTKSLTSSPPLSYTCTSPTSSTGPTSLQSYTKTSDSYSGGSTSPYSSPVYPNLDAMKAAEGSRQKDNLPHPLADSASDEGVTVDMVEGGVGGVSPKLGRNLSSPAPGEAKTPRPVPPPVAPRTNSSSSLTPPPSPSTGRSHPSPAPRPRNTGSGSGNSLTPTSGGADSTGVSERLTTGADNLKVEESTPLRPTPPARTKRSAVSNASGNSPITPNKPPPYSHSPSSSGSNTLERKATANRAPARRAPAPPPPKAKKPGPPNDELTSL